MSKSHTHTQKVWKSCLFPAGNDKGSWKNLGGGVADRGMNGKFSKPNGTGWLWK